MRQRYDAKIKYGKIDPIEYENERFQSASGKIINEVEKKTIFDLLKKHKIKNLLDVACGPGRLAFFLEEHMPSETHITAVDINENMLARAKQHAKNKKSRVSFKKADLYDPSFVPGKFDAVVGLRFSMHLPEFEIVLKNFSKILKKDGVLVFDIFNKKSLLAFNPAPGYYSFSEMLIMAKKQGFELCDRRGYLLSGVKFLEMCPDSLLPLLTSFITPASLLEYISTRLMLCFRKKSSYSGVGS